MNYGFILPILILIIVFIGFRLMKPKVEKYNSTWDGFYENDNTDYIIKNDKVGKRK